MKFYKKITEKSKSNSLVVLVSEDTDSINFSNDSVNLLFSESLSNEDLSSLGKITVLHTTDSLYKNFNFLRIICMGVGRLEEIDSNKIRRAAGSFGRYFLDSKLSDLSFYVDAEDYTPIRFFEGWIEFIANGRFPGASNNERELKSPNYYYRMNYPDDYIAGQGLKVRKFERDHSQQLEYDFIRSFP